MTIFPIIELMQRLGYSPNTKGICYGLAFMAIQSVLRGKFDEFSRRMELLEEYSLKDYVLKFYKSYNDWGNKYIYMNKQGADVYSYELYFKNNIRTGSFSLINIPSSSFSENKQVITKAKELIIADILTKDILNAEQTYYSIYKNNNMGVLTDRDIELCKIKAWIEGILIYHGFYKEDDAQLSRNLGSYRYQNWKLTQDLFCDNPERKVIYPKSNQILIGKIDFPKYIEEVLSSIKPIAYTFSNGSHIFVILGSNKKCYLINAELVMPIKFVNYMRDISELNFYKNFYPLYVSKYVNEQPDEIENFYYNPTSVKDFNVKNEYGYNVLGLALYNENSKAATEYANLILSSNLSAIQKKELLATKNNTGLPGLYINLAMGASETAKKYIDLIIHSDLSEKEKCKLIAAKDSFNFPGLYMSLKNKHYETVRYYCSIDSRQLVDHLMIKSYYQSKEMKKLLLEWIQSEKIINSSLQRTDFEQTYPLVRYILEYQRSVFPSIGQTDSMKEYEKLWIL